MKRLNKLICALALPLSFLAPMASATTCHGLANGAKASIVSLPSNINLPDYVLQVEGTSSSDQFILTEQGKDLVVTHIHLATQSKSCETFPLHKSRAVIVELKGGNDVYDGSEVNIDRQYIYGGAGDDIITGGSSDDDIYGTEGNDVLVGGDGNDRIFGGTGNDILHGGKHADFLNGGGGEDYVYGLTGKDVVMGGKNGEVLTAHEETAFRVSDSPYRARQKESTIATL